MRNIFFLIVMITTIVIASCSFKNTYFRRMETRCIPTDIRDPKYTLLVEGWTSGGFAKANTHVIENTMEKNYPDKYVVLVPQDTLDQKYSDRSKYRYYIKFMYATLVTTYGPGAMKDGTYGTNGYGVIDVYDRLTSKPLGNTQEQLQKPQQYFKLFCEYVKEHR